MALLSLRTNNFICLGQLTSRLRSLRTLFFLGYVYTGPERNRSEPNRTGSASVYTRLFWNRSGTDPNGSKIGPTEKQVQFWIRSGPVPKRSRVNRRPIRSDFRTGSVWNQPRVNIAFRQCRLEPSIHQNVKLNWHSRKI